MIPAGHEGPAAKFDCDPENVPLQILLEACFEFAQSSRRDDLAVDFAEAFTQAWAIVNPNVHNCPRLSESEAERLCALANSSIGPVMQKFIDALEKGGEAIGWRFTYNATSGRPLRVLRPLATSRTLLRWHAVHPSGLGGMFASGLGLIEKCVDRGQALLIDWSSPELLYRGYNQKGNFWDEFFTQPASALLTPGELQDLLDRGDVSEFTGTPCMQMPRVGLPHSHAIRGRLLCQRFAWLRPEVKQIAHDFASQHLPGAAGASCQSSCRWLAMHVRRSDKGDESPENLALSEDDIVLQAKITCKAWDCQGVFVCGDDWKMKLRIQNMLKSENVRVATYSSVLSADVMKCTHMDRALHAHRKLWDAVFEVAVMSLCQGLLCTHSHLANMVVFFSKPSYRYRSFWDPLPTPTSPVSLPNLFKATDGSTALDAADLWESVD